MLLKMRARKLASLKYKDCNDLISLRIRLQWQKFLLTNSACMPTTTTTNAAGIRFMPIEDNAACTTSKAPWLPCPKNV